MLAKSLPCALLLCAACGTVTVQEGPDAMAEADAEVEPTPDAVPEPCDLAMPFGDPTALTALNGADDDEFASLSPDELTIYYASNRLNPGTADLGIFVASRASRDLPFGAPVALDVVNTIDDDRSPSISPDGLELYFHSSRTGFYELYVSTRPNTTAAFSAPGLLGPGVNTTAIETSPVIAAGGDALYFDRYDAGGVPHVWRATRGPTGFTAATEVVTLSAPNSYWAAPSEDELTVYFASDRPGGAGLTDIWVASRASTTAPFGGLTAVAELNTGVAEGLDWVSPDGCRAYYTVRVGATFDLYVASRPR